MIIHNGKKVNILQELRTCFLRLCKQAYSVFNKKGESLRLFFEGNGLFLTGQDTLDVRSVLDDDRGADQRRHRGRHRDIEAREAADFIIDKKCDEKRDDRVQQAAADRGERDRFLPRKNQREKGEADQEHAPVQKKDHRRRRHDALAAAKPK